MEVGYVYDSEELYVELADAKYRLHTKLKKELEEGCLEHWQGNEDFRVDSARDSYEGYLDGEYDESHYAIRIEEKKLAGYKFLAADTQKEEKN